MTPEVQEMVARIQRHAHESAPMTGIEAIGPEVIAAMTAVSRADFVPKRLVREAFDDRPLPIGQGQTISQPFIVALMTQLLRPEASDRVLDIGTGSGYQAAVLAKLVERVETIEIVAPLAEAARQRLVLLGIDNVGCHVGDGAKGLPEAAPFDGIIVAAAGERIPAALIAQLAPGGRLVMPVRRDDDGQTLMLIEKEADGGVTRRVVLDVAFVPLTGGGASRGD